MVDAVRAGAPAGLEWFNAAPADQAGPVVASCCASGEWLRALLTDRPYPSLPALLVASDRILLDLDWDQVERALAAHPRIGEPARGLGAVETGWSAREQARVRSGPDLDRELIAGNLAYERRFGHVFLIRAAGRSSAQILAALTERLANDPATERTRVRRELAEITRGRLERVLSP